MDTCGNEGKEKYSQHLGINALSDILLRHAHLLHNLKAGLILISFRNLFVVNNEHSSKNKNYT